MRSIFVFLVISIWNYCLALPPGKGVSICAEGICEAWSDEVVTERSLKPAVILPEADKIKTAQPQVRRKDETNLPSYYVGSIKTASIQQEQVVFVSKSQNPRLKGLNAGDILTATIEQEIKASPSVSTPIRAIVLSGHYKGASLLGEAVLDRELKRILMSFNLLRAEDNEYSIKATGLSVSGSVGLEGEYESQSGKFFFAEMGAVTAAGLLDATVSRSQNSQGNYVLEPTVGNAAKVGAVTALSKSAERFSEQVKSAPEFTRVYGFQEVRIIITESPREI